MFNDESGSDTEKQSPEKLGRHGLPDRDVVERVDARVGVGRLRLADVHRRQLQAPDRGNVEPVGGQARDQDNEAS